MAGLIFSGLHARSNTNTLALQAQSPADTRSAGGWSLDPSRTTGHFSIGEAIERVWIVEGNRILWRYDLNAHSSLPDARIAAMPRDKGPFVIAQDKAGKLWSRRLVDADGSTPDDLPYLLGRADDMSLYGDLLDDPNGRLLDLAVAALPGALLPSDGDVGAGGGASPAAGSSPSASPTDGASPPRFALYGPVGGGSGGAPATPTWSAPWPVQVSTRTGASIYFRSMSQRVDRRAAERLAAPSEANPWKLLDMQRGQCELAHETSPPGEQLRLRGYNAPLILPQTGGSFVDLTAGPSGLSANDFIYAVPHSSPVPEPSVVGLFAIASSILVSRRRR